ncbi:ephexin-1 [Hypanus sabinus]|uniref:ephexin-1 n=1 Tax=Hypanus sabinus TaxID=79690 RepID=UPI0028C49A1B|nr:ephexin-1 [Hypanus sabinus]XP_059831053.1 ephexin-1 [Hypanus sabinus]XP_059831054.1 ephexin-1 [Hypanus sabinus]
MEQPRRAPLDEEKRLLKPPLKPKPPMLARTARIQDNGSHPPVPARRQPPETVAAGQPLHSSGNVQKIRELFNKSTSPPNPGRLEKKPLGVRRSESAREATVAPVPKPRVQRKHAVRSAASQEELADHSEKRVASAATRAPVAPPLSSGVPGDPQEETALDSDKEPDETVDEWCCPPNCPCLCHRKCPGMVLVWRPAPAPEGAVRTAESPSDSSESDGEPFHYVLPIGEAADCHQDSHLPTIALEVVGSDGPAGAVVPEVGNGSSAWPDGRHKPSDLPGNVTPPFGRANPLPKPPRHHKPALAGAPHFPSRRLAQVRRSGAPLPAHPDQLSDCVDRLDLHVPKTSLSPLSLPPLAGTVLKLPSPTVTRSAPPSPSEKHKQLTFNQVDGGEDENLTSNLYEIRLDILERRSSKPERGDVKDWESRFESEPLYQTYRDTVIHKEIRRQTLVRDSSKTSEDYMYESVPFITATEKVSSSLWQDLSVVQQSGILNTLSKEERRRQESMFEVLTSEASYLRSLNILIEHFMNARDLNDNIILRDKKTLFSCIVRVKKVSESFLKELEERVDESIMISDVCDIIYSHAQHNFQVYIDYVRNQFYQEQKYSQLMEENPHFAAAVIRLQELPQCQRLPLMSFLLLPFQRITRIKMLIENILQKSEVGSANEETASKALSVVSKIIEDCNREVGIMKQMEEMIHIAKKLEFDKLKAIPIISKARHLEKQGEISEIVFRENLFGVKPKITSLYLFLFNDLLLITIKKGADRYQVVDYAHRSLVEVQDGPGSSLGASIGNCFTLTLLENHQGKQSKRTLKALTESDRHRWMNALTSGQYDLQEDTNDDKVYEFWDCPQVQCLIPYTARQADELSLEPADIVNVTRKSPEGWYEGSKLSTGQKGWFPSENVQEITNEHVRRRNLKERYRLLQAAEQLHQKHGKEAASSSL